MGMHQVRYDPDTYTSSTVMDIYGTMSDDCIMKMSYSTTDTVQVSSIIDLTARASYRLYTVTPEHLDVTQRHIGLFSPVQCDEAAANPDTNEVTNPSLDVYQISDQTWTCWDMPTTYEGSSAWTLPRDDTDITSTC